MGQLRMPERNDEDLEDLPDAVRAMLHPPSRKFMSTFEQENCVTLSYSKRPFAATKRRLALRIIKWDGSSML